MMWMLLGMALAGEPPEGLDLEDVALWEERAFALTAGPAGCWNFEGEFEGRLALYLPGSFFSPAQTRERNIRGSFSSTLEDGVWQRFVYTIEPDADEEDSDDSISLRPLMGQLPSGVLQNAAEVADAEATSDDPSPAAEQTADEEETPDEDDALNILQASVDSWWNSTISTSYMRWDRQQNGAVLVREVPTSDRRNAEVVTLSAFFPEGGPHATRIDSVLPERLVLGDGPIRVTVRNGQLHLQGRVVSGWLLPTTEHWGAVFGALGYTVGYEQRIAYTSAQPCS